MAYLSSLVDNVPFSFRSKHLKASRYSMRRNRLRQKFSNSKRKHIAEKKKKKGSIGLMKVILVSVGLKEIHMQRTLIKQTSYLFCCFQTNEQQISYQS